MSRPAPPVRHVLVDELCERLEDALAELAAEAEALRGPPAGAALNAEETRDAIARIEAAIEAGLETLRRAGRKIDRRALDDECPPQPGAGEPPPCRSLADELCERLESALAWRADDAWWLRRWPVPPRALDLSPKERREAIAVLVDEIARGVSVLGRAGRRPEPAAGESPR